MTYRNKQIDAVMKAVPGLVSDTGVLLDILKALEELKEDEKND